MPPEHPKTYYSDSVNYDVICPPLNGVIHVDTCVIGGGYAGLMTQIGLLQRGHKDVVLLEGKRLGWGASGRNGGFVFAGYSLPPQKMCEHVGIDHARELYDLSVEAVNLIRHRIADFGIRCDPVDKGAIWANWFNDQDILRKEQTFMEEKMGVDWKYLPPDELQGLLRSARYYGGLLETNALHIHPLNYAYGIAEEIIKFGGNIHEGSEALVVDTENNIVETATGKVHYDNLVICGGGYIGRFFPRVSRAVLPIATYIMVTEPLDENCNDHVLTQAAIYDTRFAFDYYRKLTNGRLLWGGRISTQTKGHKQLEHKLRSDLRKVFPQLGAVPIDYIWDGWMGYSKHKMPCVGRLNENVWYNLAFGGHGVGPTTVGGELIAAAIADGDDRYHLFDRWGIPWCGGKLGLAAAQSSYWWYQSRDWFKSTFA